MKKVTISALVKRLRMKTPSFFRRVAKVSISIAGACVATKAYFTVSGIDFPIVDTWLNYGIVGGGVGTFIAFLTVEKPEDIHKNDGAV